MSEEELFYQALEQKPEERAPFLDRACGADGPLRRRLELLLDCQANPGPFLLAARGVMPEEVLGERPGEAVGSYKLLEQIGEGGFGVVFLAEQQQPVRRKVALKVLKPGMDSRPIIARFEAERQALALMDHPHIAKVLDGGATSSGRPYFVMELVKGVPITEFCDTHHLTVRDRLALFVDVCAAVQHAHQKGILHRDLKPSNVLVTLHDTVPVVKIIDFGVAKALGQELTDKTLFTGFAQVIGTPLYMSPEQAGQSGLDVDTRSDIYSLGVLLYELLTGTTPFDRERFKEAALDEIRRIIREEEPPKPSTRLSTTGELPSIAANRRLEPWKLSGLVRGELDWIVMKCLEKDRQRRYESATGLAADVRRFLQDEPVLACPPSTAYRLRKFVRRHKAGTAVAGVVLLCLLILGGGVGWVMRDLDVRAGLLEHEVLGALEEAERSIAAEQWLAARSAALRARGLLRGSSSQDLEARVERLLGDLAIADRVREIRLERTMVKGNNFDDRRSDLAYEQAFRGIGIDVLALSPDEVGQLVRSRAVPTILAAALDDWSLICRRSRAKSDQTWRVLLEAARHADANPIRVRLRAAAAATPLDIAALRTLATERRLQEAPAATQLLLAEYLRLGGAPADQLASLRAARLRFPSDFWINHALGVALHQAGSWEEAVTYYAAAVALRPESAGAWNSLGIAQADRNLPERALEAYAKAIELNPGSPMFWTNRGAAYFDLLDERDKARTDFARALQLDPGYAVAWHNLGMLQKRLGDRDEALRCVNRSLASDPSSAQFWASRGALHGELGKPDEAFADFDKALQLVPGSAVVYRYRAAQYERTGDKVKALADYARAVELAPADVEGWLGRGRMYHEQGEERLALSDFSRAITLKPDRARTYQQRGWVYEKLNDRQNALADFSHAIALRPSEQQLWYSRGAFYLNHNETDKAVEDLKQVVALKREHPEAWCGLGKASVRKREYDKALEQFTESLRYRPGYPLALNERGHVYLFLTQGAKACDDLRQLHRNDPMDLELAADLADALLLAEDVSGHAELCRELFGQAEQLKCGRTAGRKPYLLARAGLLSSRHVEDQSRLTQWAAEAVRTRPLPPGYAHLHALARYRSGALEDAVRNLESLLRDQPRWPGVPLNRLVLAMAYHRLGNPERARMEYHQAVQLIGPADPPPYEALADRHDRAAWVILRRETEQLLGLEPKRTTSDKSP